MSLHEIKGFSPSGFNILLGQTWMEVSSMTSWRDGWTTRISWSCKTFQNQEKRTRRERM